MCVGKLVSSRSTVKGTRWAHTLRETRSLISGVLLSTHVLCTFSSFWILSSQSLDKRYSQMGSYTAISISCLRFLLLFSYGDAYVNAFAKLSGRPLWLRAEAAVVEHHLSILSISLGYPRHDQSNQHPPWRLQGSYRPGILQQYPAQRHCWLQHFRSRWYCTITHVYLHRYSDIR